MILKRKLLSGIGDLVIELYHTFNGYPGVVYLEHTVTVSLTQFQNIIVQNALHVSILSKQKHQVKSDL